MQATIVYEFDTAQIATRFLNRVKNSGWRGVKAKLANGGLSVQVAYGLSADDSFSSTCADLDDMAASLGGVETSHF